MRKILLLLFIAIGVSSGICAQESLSPKVTSKGDWITVTYGQPSKRDRVVFGELVPYGEVWRTGANEATEITFKKDGKFGNKPIKAGTYTLFTVPKENEWEIILNAITEQWGAYEYEKIKAKNVLQTVVPVYKVSPTQEKLQIKVGADAVKIEWDQTGVSVPVSL